MLAAGAGFEGALGFGFAGGTVVFGFGDFCASALSGCTLLAGVVVGFAMRSRKLGPVAVVGFRADDVDADVCESGRPAREFRGVDLTGAGLGLGGALVVAGAGPSCFA